MAAAVGPYRIVIADDHDVLRFGIKTLLSRDAQIQVIGEARTGEDLIAILESKRCDLVILDLSMPGMDGLKALPEIRKRFAEMKVLVLTMHKEREFFRQALSAGVDGYILKDDDFERIVGAVHEIRNGKKTYSPELASFIVEDYTVLRESAISLELLTRREREILKRIAQGRTNKEIADELDISPRTAQTHRSNLMHKLDLKNTADLVRFAVSHGIV